jgi:hypothetical protein
LEVIMATQHGRLSLSLYDDSGGGGTFLTHVNVDDTLTIADTVTALGAFKTLYLTVGNGGIKSASFSVFDEALASSPVTTDRIGAGGVFDFGAGSPPRTYGQWVAALKPALVMANGTIDITTGVPLAFVTSLLGAVLGGNYANAAYANLATATDAFSSNRKRSKRVRP